jgi:hypothetical protein
MTPSKGRGIIDIPSNHSVDETVEKPKGILQAKGVTLFALVDHSGEAERGRNEIASHHSGLGRCAGESLGHLQQPGLFAGAAQPATGTVAKHRGS